MRQVFNAPNIILIALLAEFVSIAQRHIHEFDVKGDSISSRPKAEIKKSQVRRIVHSSQMMYNLKYRLGNGFWLQLGGQEADPLCVEQAVRQWLHADDAESFGSHRGQFGND